MTIPEDWIVTLPDGTKKLRDDITISIMPDITTRGIHVGEPDDDGKLKRREDATDPDFVFHDRDITVPQRVRR